MVNLCPVGRQGLIMNQEVWRTVSCPRCMDSDLLRRLSAFAVDVDARPMRLNLSVLRELSGQTINGAAEVEPTNSIESSADTSLSELRVC